MNKPHFLQKLAPLGFATLSTITIIGIAPSRADAATAYGYSQASFNVGFTTNGFTIDSFQTETSSFGALNGFIDGAQDPFDAPQACIGTAASGGITGGGVGDCVVPANTFAPRGQIDPDYVRSDVLIDSASVSGIDAENVAEGFVDSLVDGLIPATSGTSNAEWEYGTNLFTTELGDSLTIDIQGGYELSVEVAGLQEGEEAFAEAEYAFGIGLNGTNLLDFVPDDFNFTEEVSRIENASVTLADNIDTTYTVFFGDVNGNGIIDGNEIETGTYNITVDAIEEIAVRATPDTVPEPAFILGLLTVSGLGLTLKCKKQL